MRAKRKIEPLPAFPESRGHRRIGRGKAAPLSVRLFKPELLIFY
jgi:hypothetical protein